MYLGVHNKIPVEERLFRINLSNDPYCHFCLDADDALICDLEHVFCLCRKVSDLWEEMRKILEKMVHGYISNIGYLSLQFDSEDFEKETVWLIASYMHEVWVNFQRKGTEQLSRDLLFGFLKFKFKKEQLGARTLLKNIPGLFDL